MPIADPSSSDLPAQRGPLRAALVALRPRQWTKNLLLFAGIVFAAETGDGRRWGLAVAAFVAWCAASSAAYLVNDVHDLDADRRHPAKRRRPVAQGELAPRAALALAALLAVAALGVTAALGPGTLACLVAFLGLQLAYTTVLKRIVLVDVVAIAGLFVLRAVGGARAVEVPVSGWLLVCTALLALFLGLGKRRAELGVVDGDDPGATRASLAHYDRRLLDVALALVAAATVVAYAVYALVARETVALVATVPLVALGVGRYLMLLRRGTRGEEPENVLLDDRPILVLVAVWALACAVILALAEG